MFSTILSTVIGPLMPFLVRAISKHLEKIKAKEETKRAWIGFIGAMEKDSGSSAKLADSYEDQLQKLKEETGV